MKVMFQCRVINFDTIFTQVCDADNGGIYACVRTGGIWKNLSKFDYKTKNLLKNKDKMIRELCGFDIWSNSKIKTIACDL